jgi:mycoredoxin
MDITLYLAFWCVDCREIRRFLQRNNITYKEVDIESTPDATEEVIRRTGKRAIPQLVINGLMGAALSARQRLSVRRNGRTTRAERRLKFLCR